ncbi:ABC transporter ATP-binding protein [Gorillibacterium timonense]|uniref:ABC transporter ATP-binding protein n=1 Tax=Gorillibacterium timonense TaxID=1689269 RepID=UPI00071E3308|nr:ABC transporter ATP-binding protein [Gorillibacterium timonense]
MLQITGLKKQFRVSGGSLPILDVPSWQVNTGEQVALTGPSGSGKSTLLHLISGISLPDEGSIKLNEVELTALNETRRDRCRSAMIGYVLQDFHLIPSLSARQNIDMALSAKLSAKQRYRLILEWLDRVGLADRADHRPSQLSRGQQQRVAIIRALVNNPPVLLADEPTGSLDYETAAEISQLLLDLGTAGKQTMIVVTHDTNLAALFPKQVDIRDVNVLRKPVPQPQQTLGREASPA